LSRQLRVWFAAATALLAVPGPAWSNGNSCGFQAKGLSMSFGSLDPSSGANITRSVNAATLNANRVGDCSAGQTMQVSGGNGQYFGGGSRRMSNGSDFIRYSLSLPLSGLPGPGNGTYVAFTFNGTVLGTDYANASAGTYSDTVVITVSP
jgi:spore coat protein U-like protein